MPARRPILLTVTRKPGSATEGLLTIAGNVLPCSLGRGGITRFKREGDGATPAARMRLVGGFYRAERIARPPSPIPLRPTRTDDGWADDPTDGRYNRLVRLPFAKSHETMCRADRLYDIVVVLDWNVSRRSLGRGSAIFFHLTRPDRGPTAGCVAVSEPDMRKILARIGNGAVMVVR